MYAKELFTIKIKLSSKKYYIPNFSEWIAVAANNMMQHKRNLELVALHI